MFKSLRMVSLAMLLQRAPCWRLYSTRTALEPAKTLTVLATAERAARSAGQLMRENMGAEVKEQKLNFRDVVTETDLKCEKVIREAFQSDFPSFCMLGEESVEPGSKMSMAALKEALKKADEESDGWLVIADPVDGTANFAMGMPLCVVSIGILHRGEGVVGCIYNPASDEMFTAVKGGGAYLNGEPIRVRDDGDVRNAIINCGYPARSDAQAQIVKGMSVLAQEVRGLRMLSSAALVLTWIACGRLSGYFSFDLNSWDIAAGEVILREAGGQITNLDKTPYTAESRNILASNGLIHDAVLGILEDAGAVDYEC
mmetsp:Transcript_12182/g.45202  ORF Transcript_12182/g.45202 Transcript_12182/m.45202 type:complete len:314 (-) Transcript_12182:43-984(-)